MELEELEQRVGEVMELVEGFGFLHGRGVVAEREEPGARRIL